MQKTSQIQRISSVVRFQIFYDHRLSMFNGLKTLFCFKSSTDYSFTEINNNNMNVTKRIDIKTVCQQTNNVYWYKCNVFQMNII